MGVVTKRFSALPNFTSEIVTNDLVEKATTTIMPLPVDQPKNLEILQQRQGPHPLPPPEWQPEGVGVNSRSKTDKWRRLDPNNATLHHLL
jgi:hypothetical protein